MIERWASDSAHAQCRLQPNTGIILNWINFKVFYLSSVKNLNSRVPTRINLPGMHFGSFEYFELKLIPKQENK